MPTTTLRFSFTFGLIAVWGCADPVPSAELGRTPDRAEPVAKVPTQEPPRTSPVPEFVDQLAHCAPPVASATPISGGTLHVTADGRYAVASDPDRDTLAVVDVNEKTLRGEIQLCRGDGPGRLAETPDGRVHVVLRGAGAVLSIEPDSLQVVARRAVCPSPQGIDYDEKAEALTVVCYHGEVFRLPSDGPPQHIFTTKNDLRDVVVIGDNMLVSRFRTAQILVINRVFDIERQVALVSPHEAVARVAWRMTEHPMGVIISHQRANAPRARERGGSSSGYYGAPPPPPPDPDEIVIDVIVHATVTVLSPDGDIIGWTPAVAGSVLPVDVAPFEDGSVVLASAGALAPDRLQIIDVPAELIPTNHRWVEREFSPKFAMRGQQFDGLPEGAEPVAVQTLDGQVIAQTRRPFGVRIGSTWIDIAASPEDAGHRIFHSDPGGNIACASCHPEGRDDGFVWAFVDGWRRTQPLIGGISKTAPYHWGGDRPTFRSIMDDTFTDKMSGPVLDDRQVDAVFRWIDRQPQLRSFQVADAQKARGRAVFERPDVACSHCHNGPDFSDHRAYDVGTEGTYDVPSLIGLAHRAPYGHSGSTSDVLEVGAHRALHGNVEHLTAAERADLTAFLLSL